MSNEREIDEGEASGMLGGPVALRALVIRARAFRNAKLGQKLVEDGDVSWRVSDGQVVRVEQCGGMVFRATKMVPQGMIVNRVARDATA